MNNHIFSEIRLDGGDLSLDFTNTIDDRLEEPNHDYLHTYFDLVNWAHFANGIGLKIKEKLLTLGEKNKHEASKVFTNAIVLREAMYIFIQSMLNQKDIPSDEIAIINQTIAAAYSNLELNQQDDMVTLEWSYENIALESILWPIIRAFVELITSEEKLDRIKQCPNCGWVFIDESKNKSRRWCSMETCGNRVKARRYAQNQLHKSSFER
jgi:predicted RNA-binding Zn ribbon-like protein